MLSLFKKKKEYSPKEAASPENKNREIVVYVVIQKNSSEITNIDASILQENPPLTIAASMQDVQLFVDKLYYLDHFEHYQSWCELRQKDVDQFNDSWEEYKGCTQSGIMYETKYSIIRLTYTTEEISRILRTFSLCAPLFLPYENTNELSDYFIGQYQQNHSMSISHHLGVLMKINPQIDTQVRTMLDSLNKRAQQLQSENVKKNNNK